MFERERHIVGLQLKGNADNARRFEEQVQRISKYMTISAICQEVGMQAAFAAATMGAASALTATAPMVAGGEWLAGLGAESSAVRATVAFTARVGGLSTGAVGAAALTGVLSRATAGVLVLLARRLTGDLGTAQPMNTNGLAGALFMTVVVAWAGSPGAPTANVTPLKLLVQKLLPSAGSWQTAIQTEMVMFSAMNGWAKQQENRALIEQINANRQKFNLKIEQFAENPAARELVEWAVKVQPDIARNVAEAAGKINYAKLLPSLARYTDFVGNASALRDMSTGAAVCQAQIDLWISVNHALNDLEHAVATARQMGN